jgi:uncharacterized protein YjdB
LIQLIKQGNKFIAAALVFILLMINSTTAFGAGTVTLTRIILSSSELTVAIGDSANLTATGVFSDGTTEALTVYTTWNSGDANIASVYNGTVIGKAEGTVNIVASYDNISTSAYVTVTKKVKALTKDTQSLSLRNNETADIKLTATYSDNSTSLVSDKAEWTSSNENVASVVNGKVKGLSAGTATITATYGKKSITVETKVEVVNRLEASKSQLSLLLRAPETIVLTATYADGTTKDVTSSAEWSSSNEDVADVLNGVVTGYSAGTATLTATYGTKSTTITVNVDKTTKLDVDDDSIFLNVKGTQQMKLTAKLDNGSTSDVTSSAVWSSSDEDVAYVSKGLITGYKSGSALIKATYNGKVVEISVDVDVARHLDISETKLGMSSTGSGNTATVVLKATYADGSQPQDVTSKATWSSDNATAAYASKGIITAYKVGTAKITASYGGKSVVVTVSVDEPLKLTTSSKEMYLEVDEDDQADAIAVYGEDHEVAITDDATWSSSDEAIVKVKNGLVTGVSSGSATITATYGGQTVTIEVNISIAKRIEASKKQVALLQKGTENIILTATYADGSTKDVTKLASWTSSNEDIADALKGVITGYSSGTATITASYGTKTTTITVDVDKTIKLDVSDESVFLKINGTKQLALTATYADGRAALPVTDTATWSSSDEAIAYVSKGLVTGYKSGSATITAVFNGKTVKVTVDVEKASFLEISKDKLALSEGEPASVTLTVTYANGVSELVTDKATWTSVNEDVAIVSKGQITARKMGTTKISGSYGGKTATVTVSVGVPNKLTTTTKTVRLETDKEFKVDITAVYADNSTKLVTEDVEWSSKDEKIATVKDGLIVGIGEGTTTITAAYGDLSVKITVNVGLTEELAVSTRLIALASMESEQVTLKATDEDGVTKDVTADAKWSSNKSSVADVNKGLVKAYSKGKATITATYGGETVSIAVEVDQISRIEASVPSVSLKTGGHAQVKVTVFYNDGESKDVTSLSEWKTASYKVVTVKNGEISAVAYGKTSVTASYGGKTVKIAVDVDTLKYLETSEVVLTLKVGAQAKLIATATYSDQSEADVSKPALWTSSKITVATTKDGVIKATGKGKATITVDYAGKKVKVIVTVN